MIEVDPETYEITEYTLTDLQEGDIITVDVYKDELDAQEDMTPVQIQIKERSKAAAGR